MMIIHKSIFLNFGINKIKVLNSKKMYKQNNYKLIILFAYDI